MKTFITILVIAMIFNAANYNLEELVGLAIIFIFTLICWGLWTLAKTIRNDIIFRKRLKELN